MKTFKKLLVVFSVIAVVMALNVSLWAEEVEKININEASVEELAKLKRIGPKYSARIVEYREKNGPFEKPEDIMKVKGIGKKTYEANKDRIVVE